MACFVRPLETLGDAANAHLTFLNCTYAVRKLGRKMTKGKGVGVIGVKVCASTVNSIRSFFNNYFN